MNSLIKINGNREGSIFPEFPSLFDDFITRDFFNLPVRNAFKMGSVPAVNIRETDGAFDLEMAIPGMDKKNFKVEVENDLLTISANQENKIEEKGDDGKYTRREFSYQSFKREFRLPENSVNEGEISANYKDGILHVILPKKETTNTKALREISIS